MRRFSRQVVECVIILVLLEEKIKRPAWRSLFPHEQGGSRILHVIPAKRKNIFAGESRPTRARGLKQNGDVEVSGRAGRAPRGRVD